MFKVEEYDSSGKLLWCLEGPIKDIIIPMLSQLSNIDGVVADAKALRDKKIMPSVLNKLKRGKLRRID